MASDMVFIGGQWRVAAQKQVVSLGKMLEGMDFGHERT